MVLMINIVLALILLVAALWRFSPRAVVAHGAKSEDVVHPNRRLYMAGLYRGPDGKLLNLKTNFLVTVEGNSCRQDGIFHGDTLAAHRVDFLTNDRFEIDDIVLIDSVKENGDRPWRLRKVEGLYLSETDAVSKSNRIPFEKEPDQSHWVAFFDGPDGETWRPKPATDVRGKVVFIRH